MGIEVGQPLCSALADVVEMGRVAADHAAYGDDGIHIAALSHEGCAIDEFETAGDAAHGNARGADAVSGERIDGTFEQAVGDLVVPFANNDAYAHIGGIGNGGNIFAEIEMMRGHGVGELWFSMCVNGQAHDCSLSVDGDMCWVKKEVWPMEKSK